MQDRLPLPPPTVVVALAAVLLHLRDVPADRSPAADLPLVVWSTPPHVVAAIPLKPAARVIGVNPALLAPNRERLRRVHAEEIQVRIVPLVAQLGSSEPLGRKLIGAIRHVLPAEHAEFEQLFRGQLGSKIIREILAGRFREKVDVAALHQVFDDNFFLHHTGCLSIQAVLTQLPKRIIAPDRVYLRGYRGWLWLAICFAMSAAWCVTAGRELGPTFDEPFYLQAGLHSWHGWHQKDLLTAGTMPLPAKLVTLPLAGWELFHGERLDVLSHMDDWLPIARAMTLVFWFLLLLGGYLGGRLWSGELAGCLAVAFLTVEPILLGHASLATTDLAFTACLLLLAAAFKAGRDGPHRRRITIPAILCAVTLLAKASALVFIPVVLLAIEVEHRWQLGQLRDRAAWKQSARDLFAIGWRGLLVVFVLCPLAFLAFRLQFEHNIAGHGTTFLLGEASVDGFWYYFPAALAIKTSLALIVLLALFLIRPRYLANGPMLAALALLLLSPAFRVQIGVRFVSAGHCLRHSRSGHCIGPLVRGLSVAIAAADRLGDSRNRTRLDGHAIAACLAAGIVLHEANSSVALSTAISRSAIPTTIGAKDCRNLRAGTNNTRKRRSTCGTSARIAELSSHHFTRSMRANRRRGSNSKSDFAGTTWRSARVCSTSTATRRRVRRCCASTRRMRGQPRCSFMTSRALTT